MAKHHQVLWYGPGRVTPREFRFTRLSAALLILIPVLFAAVFVLGVFFFVSFNTRMDELAQLQDENRLLRDQVGRVAHLEQRLTELNRFQDQVRRSLTEGADMQRIMEAGEAVTRERPGTLTESDWLPIAEALETQQAAPLEVLSMVETTGPVQLPERWPVDGFITRGFEFSPIDPGRSHSGIDLAVPRGTAVRSVSGGTVVVADWTPRYGHRVIIDHGGGMLSSYGHNELLLVKAGDRVKSGAPIAISGNSGTSTAPHLHLEIWVNGRAVDPRALLPSPADASPEAVG